MKESNKLLILIKNEKKKKRLLIPLIWKERL